MTRVLGAVLGLVSLALVLLLDRQDLSGVGDALRLAPLGLAVCLAVHVPQIVLTGLAWRVLLPPPVRPSVGAMAVLRWLREALDALVPAGAIVGQAVAARRLTGRGVPVELAGATATVDMAVEGATQAPFTLLGLLLLLALRGDPSLAWVAALGVAMVTAAATALVVAQRNLPVRPAEAALAHLSRRWPALRGDWLAGLQRDVLRLHADHRALAAAALCHFAAWSLGAVEIAGVLVLLGHPVSLHEGYVVESLTQALRSAAFMVPGALGVQEGAIVASCALFGVPAEAALTLALLRRAREMLIGLLGLWVWRGGARVAPAAGPTAVDRP